MSQFTNYLKTRVRELTTTIDAQKTELAAYEQLLGIELAKESKPAEKSPSESAPQAKVIFTPTAPTVALANVSYTGNKTTLMADIVRSFGKAGASPKDVDRILTEKKIERSQNLVYNTLSYLVGQKKLQRKDGRYFSVGTTPAPAKASKSAAPAKRRISPEGIRRIREAVKKRWAAKRAAERASA